ncbi:AtpZ/AtpI family protein [Falsiroseomonas sp.]|uniref:AtpZ/AtpI family protein n=1 Tax=Falsiroseomonas sp. TaxID=2870721 RepID=UPI002733F0FC|nr:AtpZ/AtpI family protein [Falsiroseomonas sp.]MDP3414765.1 AtpZ/AtpI family protein [Falsiroseomonas sp.]
MTGERDRESETEAETIARKSRRLETARKRTTASPWRGLGMFGLVGWSVAVPVVAGIALGIWMDRHWPGRVSWTLTLLVAGAALGALNAWFWVQREGRDD